MKKNVGSIDRVIRLVVGVVVIGLGIYFKSWWGLVGLVPLLTGLMSTCPAWSLLGISTDKKIKTEKL